MSTEERAASEAPRAPAGPEQAAAARVDAVAIGAIFCILIGWFVLDTVDSEIAGIRLGFHFYQMGSVIAHPARLFTGLAAGDGIRGVLFGALCLAVLAGAFIPQNRAAARLRLAYLAPLALMLVSGALLYERTSGEFFAQSGASDAVSAHLLAFANTVAHRLSAAASRHVSVGLGAYLAFAASLVLAARALPRARAGARDF